MKDKLKEIKPITYLTAAVFFFGCLLRLIGLSGYPAGLNQDEAFSGYEAYCLATTGADSFGYRNPVYLTAWGSGMNALNSYLIAPLVKLFGSHVLCIRLPQAVLGCLSLLAIYKLFEKLLDQKAGLTAMFILAVMPWHIMESRWGLESNLAPEFLLFGLCFFIYGMEQPKYYIWSALMYGLSLYCYATIWPIVPFILLFQVAYAAYYRKIHFDRYLLISAGIIALFGTPLLLFLLVNRGVIPEIKTPVFSVPKLLYMRESEISFEGFSQKMQNLASILWKQNDGLPWNATQRFGLFYKFSFIFAGIGLIYMIFLIVQNFRKKECNGILFLLIGLMAAFFLGCLIEVNINRVNSIHIPLICCIILGVLACGRVIWKHAPYVLMGVYLIFCLQFVHYYMTDYNTEIGFYFQAGIDDAVRFAVKQDGEIYVENISYPKVLYSSKTDPATYRQTVQYTNYPSAFLDVSSFDRFHFGYDPGQLDPNGTYIIDVSQKDAWQGIGFQTQEFGNFAVAY